MIQAEYDRTGLVAGLGARWRGFVERRPATYARVTTVLVVGTWMSVLLVALALAFVPGLFAGLRPWLWCLLVLAVAFVGCRTKTLTWRALTLVFTAGLVLAPVIGGVDVLVAHLAGVGVLDTDAAVWVAPPVEETLTLLPLALLAVYARPRLSSFAAIDFMLVGLAGGLGLQAYEDGLRRLGAHSVGLFTSSVAAPDHLGIYPHYALAWLPGGAHAADEGFYAGHQVTAALVATGIGLARRGRRRAGRKIWALPVLLYLVVVVDHAMYNASGGWFGWFRGDRVIPPGWLHTLWRLWGAGFEEGPLLVVAAVTAMVADVRRTRRVWLLLPGIPALGFVGGMRGWSQRAAVSLYGWVPDRGAGLLKRLAAAAAGVLRWLGYLLADSLGELALLVIAMPRARRGATPGERDRTRRRWVHTVVALRERRRYAQEIGRAVERGGADPLRLPSFALASLACVVPVGVGMVLLARGGHGPAGPVGRAAAYVPELYGDLGPWWTGLSFGQQTLAVLGVLALFTLTAVGLVPEVSSTSRRGDGVDFVNRPREVTAAFLSTHLPGHAAGYVAEWALGLLVPARAGGPAAPDIRRALDDLPTDLTRYARAERAVVGWLAGGPEAIGRRGMPAYLTQRLRSGQRLLVKRNPYYTPHEVILADGKRFDAYQPHEAMVSRKFSQLGQVKPEIAIGYLAEALRRYTPGDVLVDTPYNRTNFRSLVGSKLHGDVRLEAPVQETSIPRQVLEAADQLGVTIVDEAGTVYNP